MGSWDKDSINYGLLFSLTMEEATGTAITGDAAKPHHTTTLTHSPAWVQLPSGVWVMDFDGANDYLQLAAASSVDLNFTTSAFTVGVWIYSDSIAGDRNLLTRGLWLNDGWQSIINNGEGRLWIRTNQAADGQQTYSVAAIVISNWYFVLFTRNGASVRTYINGIDKTAVAGSHNNPLTSARNLYVGTDDGLANKFDGKMWNPRIWSRALAPEEVNWMFQRERWMFRV